MTFISSGAIIALYISIFIITKKNKGSGDYILFIYFILNSLIFTLTFIAYNYNEEDLLFFIINIDMLGTPIWYLYIYKIAVRDPLTKRRLIRHLLPYFITLLILITYAEVVGDSEFERLVELPFLKQPVILSIISLWELLVVPFYIVLSLKVLKKHKESIKDFYSYTKGVDLQWLLLFIALHFLGWLILYGLYWFNFNNSLMIGISINGFLILYLGYFGIKHVHRQFIPEKYTKSSIESSSIENYIEIVKRVLEQDKPYLDSKMNLVKLSELTDIPSHKLSQVLSQGFKMNFYDLINSYRVNEFKERAINPDNSNFTLLSIALDSGFNSKSSFNRIFKEKVKLTPREFLSQALAV